MIAQERRHADCSSSERRAAFHLPQLQNCHKICCKKYREMLRTRPKSSAKKVLTQRNTTPYASTYSNEFNPKSIPVSKKVVIGKETDSHLTIGGLVPDVMPEPALLRHIHFQSNYNNQYQGRERETAPPPPPGISNTIIEEIEEDNGEDEENGTKEDEERKKEEREEGSEFHLPKEFEMRKKTHPRILSIFQQDYQVPYLTEKLRAPSKRRPIDCYRPLPLVSQKHSMQTSYDRDYGSVKLPELEFMSATLTGRQRENKVQFKSRNSWIN